MATEWAAENALANLIGAKIVPFEGRLGTNGRFSGFFFHKLISIRSRIAGVSGPSKETFIFAMYLRKEYMSVLRNRDIKKWLYIFDTWEPNWIKIEQVLKDAENVDCVYMSSSQAAHYFENRLPLNVKWLPQAVNGNEWSRDCLDWSKKKDIVLNIGRVNSTLDSFFLEFCAEHKFEYIREDKPGQVCFPSRKEFLEILHKSKIVVVHPRNLEFPEVTGCVSMLTARYFEAFQSGAVVCGFRPESREFEAVLDGFPFVDFTSPGAFERNLLRCMRSPGDWRQASIEIQENHTWEKRLQRIVDDYYGQSKA